MSQLHSRAGSSRPQSRSKQVLRLRDAQRLFLVDGCTDRANLALEVQMPP
jgi:hypothetical protein